MINDSSDSKLQWFDNHCHLTSLEDNPAHVVAAAAEQDVTHLLTVGCTVADSADAAKIADQFPFVWSTAGVHPHEAKDGIVGLVDLLADPNVVAVGECGLDYFYEHSPRDSQAEVFEQQIALAKEHDLALVIHTREAWEDTFAVLDNVGIPERTVFHCFTGGPTEAEASLERGAFLSFSGIVTFPTAGDLQAAAKMAPLDRMLVETDSPYLAPVPHRGNKNKPAWVADVGRSLAETIDIDPEELAAVTFSNSLKLYDLS